MKIAILVIAALVGFWVVGAVLEQFGKRAPASGASPQPENASSPEPEPHQNDPIDDACRVLQVGRPFTSEELRNAYRLQMSKYHPDKVSGLGQELRDLAESKAKDINHAFNLLARFSKS